MSLVWVNNGASFSPCRVWRYRLWRIWDPDRPYLNTIGLNPSTADETQNDPTVTRCMRLAQRLGYGGLLMTNIFAYRSTDPKGLRDVTDPVGPESDAELGAVAEAAGMIVVAWGTHGDYLRRGRRVLRLLAEQRALVYCLGQNADGSPKHPLYLSNSVQPRLYQWQGV